MTSQSQGHQTSGTNLWNYYLVISLDYATLASAPYRREETKKSADLRRSGIYYQVNEW